MLIKGIRKSAKFKIQYLNSDYITEIEKEDDGSYTVTMVSDRLYTITESEFRRLQRSEEQN